MLPCFLGRNTHVLSAGRHGIYSPNFEEFSSPPPVKPFETVPYETSPVRDLLTETTEKFVAVG